MRASEALRKPGDAARRESDGAVAVWQMHRLGLLEIAVFTEKGVEWCSAYDLHKLGEGWQPLVTAERVEELERRIDALNAASEGMACAYRNEMARTATLTAELEKARSGEAWVGEQIKAGDWIHGGQFYWQEDEPIDCLILRRQPSSVSTCVGSETTDYRYCYRYTGPTTAPLPPAAPAPEEAGRKQMLDAYPEDVNHCAEPTPTPAPAKPEWLAKGVLVEHKTISRQDHKYWWAFREVYDGVFECRLPEVYEGTDVWRRELLTVIPHPDNDPELAAALEQE